MIREATPKDVDELKRLLESAIRHSVAKDENEAEFLVDDTSRDLDGWEAEPAEKLLLVEEDGSGIRGLVLVKNAWNLSLLFVRPDSQRQGVGKSLLERAITHARALSPQNALRVNSSFVGEAFYREMGFETFAEPIDRPGGCIPLAITFSEVRSN